MTIGRKSKIAIAVVGVPVVLTSIWGVSVAAGLGDWMGNWGSTGIERSIRLPGDDVLPDAANMGTKAISIKATPEEIWRWIEPRYTPITTVGDDRFSMRLYHRKAHGAAE